MLFQGEEWAASTPFAFFTSHPEPELAKATAEGRLAEFERMGWDPDQVLDPQDPTTYQRSILQWDEASTGHHAQVLAGYRALATLRKEHPELTDPTFGRATVDETQRRLTVERGRLAIHLNLGEEIWHVPASEVLFSTTGSVPTAPDLSEFAVQPGSGVLAVR
jgi:maltooligosyltrehalose trehalohydrolase